MEAHGSANDGTQTSAKDRQILVSPVAEMSIIITPRFHLLEIGDQPVSHVQSALTRLAQLACANVQWSANPRRITAEPLVVVSRVLARILPPGSHADVAYGREGEAWRKDNTGGICLRCDA